MTIVNEMYRLQQNIKELNQTFNALARLIEDLERKSSPEYPNELRDDTTAQIPNRFYRD